MYATQRKPEQYIFTKKKKRERKQTRFSLSGFLKDTERKTQTVVITTSKVQNLYTSQSTYILSF